MKQYIKQSLLYLLRSLGVFERIRIQNRSRLIVLCYHSIVSDDSPVNSRTNIAVSAGMFEKQLQLIQSRWNPVSLKEIEAACLEKKPLPDYSVFVTFDDGFRNNFTLAAPTLKKHAVPAVVFVTSGLIGTNEMLWPQEVYERVLGRKDGPLLLPQNLSKEFPHSPRAIVQACKRLSQENRQSYILQLRGKTELDISSTWQNELYEFMNWDEVRQLKNFGIDVGAHTVSHPILTSLQPADLEWQLHECKIKIEQELGMECFSVAYPNGTPLDYSDAVIDAAKKIGYKLGFTLSEKRNKEFLDMMKIDRICVTRDLSIQEFELRLFQN